MRQHPHRLVKCVLTTGPRPHLRGYVSRSMITLLIFAMTPWSHVAITAVVIRAIAANRGHSRITALHCANRGHSRITALHCANRGHSRITALHCANRGHSRITALHCANRGHSRITALHCANRGHSRITALHCANKCDGQKNRTHSSSGLRNFQNYNFSLSISLFVLFTTPCLVSFVKFIHFLYFST